jgi:outer membrane autotransporter protein
VRLEPFAGAAYVNLRTDAFDEHGGAAALHGRGDSDGMAFSTLGVRPSAAFRVGGATLTVDGTLGWRHAYGSRTPTSTLSFAGGGAFSTAGVPVARDAAVVEAGIDAAIAPDLKLGLSYSGQFGGGTRDQGFRASFSLAF